MNIWTEHRNPEGRTYWFNTNTKESVWEKPDDLKTPFERALNQTPWKEYVSGGRKYYYNTETKVSSWDMPQDLKLLMAEVEKGATPGAPATPATPTTPAIMPGTPVAQGALVVSGAAGTPSSQSSIQPGLNGAAGALVPPSAPGGALPTRPNLPEDPVIPHNGFATYEEGERAFVHLLRKAGIDPSWTWDQTMRTIITDPLYKALNTLAERKQAWQKYIEGLKAKEQEEREARMAKLRPSIRNMLKGNPNVFPYTTFPTADRLFEKHPIWQQARIVEERKSIFEEYVAELRQQEMQEQRAKHSRALQKVVALFKDLQVDVLTKWRQAHQRLVESDEWKSDKELQELPTLDVLLAFEDFARVQEREFEEQMRRQQVEKTRKERKAREGFKALLQELLEAGHIKARTKWKTVYPTFKDDERYRNMLGQSGSNPLELFWDVVDALDQKLDEKVAVVDAAMRALPSGPEGEHFVVTPDMSMDEFLAAVRDDAGVKQLSSEDLEEVYNTLHLEAIKRKEDDLRRAERKQRHLQDDLRYALKKLPEPIDINMAYEDAVPAMEHLPEFKALEDEGRRAAFSKYVKRQKERMREASEDGGSTTSRRRKEPSGRESSHHDRDRDRDRDYSSRSYDRGKSSDRGYRDEDRDYYSSRGGSKHHRGYDRDDRRRGSRSERYDRDRDASYGGHSDPREKRELSYDEKADGRSEKRPRYDSEPRQESPRGGGGGGGGREDTPEEGEI